MTTAFDKFKKLVANVKQDHGSEALEHLAWDDFSNAVAELEPELSLDLNRLTSRVAELEKWQLLDVHAICDERDRLRGQVAELERELNNIRTAIDNAMK